MNKKITVIGPGVMGEAIIAGLLRTGLASPAEICASGPLRTRTQALKTAYGIKSSVDNYRAVKTARVVILSVKPQQLEAVYADLAGKVPADAVVISIVAGATLERLRLGLSHHAIVRSMPNASARIGESITVWTASREVSPDQLLTAKEILQAFGRAVWVDDESYIDMATAVSGTGPAYAFLFMEAMIDAGVHLGFPRRIAEELVIYTLKGSVDYYLSRMTHPAALRNDITSPAGTSAAALYYLEKAGFRTAISRAIWAAYERSKELGAGIQQSTLPTN